MLFYLNILRNIRIIRINLLYVIRFQLQSCINYVWFDRPCMFNTLLNDNVLRIIRYTRIKQLSLRQ